MKSCTSAASVGGKSLRMNMVVIVAQRRRSGAEAQAGRTASGVRLWCCAATARRTAPNHTSPMITGTLARVTVVPEQRRRHRHQQHHSDADLCGGRVCRLRNPHVGTEKAASRQDHEVDGGPPAWSSGSPARTVGSSSCSSPSRAGDCAAVWRDVSPPAPRDHQARRRRAAHPLSPAGPNALLTGCGFSTYRNRAPLASGCVPAVGGGGRSHDR